MDNYCSVADLQRKNFGRPRGPISFNFMQFLGKFGATTSEKSWICPCGWWQKDTRGDGSVLGML